jgi:WS/DGAT/MGAT family acyltransferase
MSNVDAAWLGMDRPQNLMMITAVLWFDQPADWSRLREVVEARMTRRYPKFSQRAVPTNTPFEQPVWQPDPSYALERHLEQVRLPGDGDQNQLATMVSDLMSVPLPMERSPWQMHLVDNVRGDDGRPRSVVVARLHHCLADGIALAQVLLSLTDDTAEAEPADPASDPRAGERDARRPGLLHRLSSGSTEALGPAELSVSRGLLRPRAALAALRFGLDVVHTVLRVLLWSRDPRTRFRGTLGTRKGAAWTESFDLDEVKAVAAGLGATVNDVLLASTAGAIRRYLCHHGERPHDLRVFVPVNLRPAGAPVPSGLGNRFGLVFVRLPVSEPDAVARVRSVHAQMQRLKRSSEPAAVFAVLSILGALPSWLHTVAVRVLGSKSTAVVTNVPGPPARVFLAGTTLDRIVFWVPQAGSVALGVSIFSYAGQVTVGVAADAGLVDDPYVLTAAVQDALQELRNRVHRGAPGGAAPDVRSDEVSRGGSAPARPAR